MGVETRRELHSPRGPRPNLASQLDSIVTSMPLPPGSNAVQPDISAPALPFPRPPPEMPSTKVMYEAASRQRAAAAQLAQTYLPVTRHELRTMVRQSHQQHPKLSPRSGSQQAGNLGGMTSNSTTERGAAEPGRARPQSAMFAATQAMASSQAVTAAANARNIVRCYEMYVSQGTDPQIALHAARAHAATMQQRVQQQHRDEQRRRLHLPRRGLTHAAGQPVPAETALEAQKKPRAVRPSSAAVATTPRPSTASRDRSDQLLPFGYQTLGPIAAGAFTMVTRARHLETGREVAVKTFLMRTKGGRKPDLEGVKSELACLMKLRPSAHPSIANLVETHESVYETHAILHLGSGGSLLRHLQSQRHGTGLEELQAVSYTGQIASALAHMHELGVTHRDVKPGNVVFDDGTRVNVRLVDFGFAKSHRVEQQPNAESGVSNAASGQTQLRRFKTQCGTPSYMAPELVRGGAYFGPPVDCWALGVFLYELLHSHPPFRAATIQDLNVRIMKCSIDPFAKHVSKASQNFVRRCMTVDVGERLHAKDASRVAREIGERLSERGSRDK